MHHIAVAGAGNQVFGGFGVAARVEQGTGSVRNGLGLKHVLLNTIVVACVGEVILRPDAIDHIQPLGGAGVAVVVLLEAGRHTWWPRPPTRRDNVKREPPATDMVDVGGLFREQCRIVEGRAHGDHDLRVCVTAASAAAVDQASRRRATPLMSFRFSSATKREVEADLFGAAGEARRSTPRSAPVSCSTLRSQPPKTGSQ